MSDRFDDEATIAGPPPRAAQAAAPPPTPPTPTPPRSTITGGTGAAAPGGNAGKGLGSVASGLLGGLLGGLVACLLFGLTHELWAEKYRAGWFAALVAPTVGFAALSLQHFLVRRPGLAMRRGAIGAAMAGLAGLLGLAVADPLFGAMVGDPPTDGELVLASSVVWAIVAGLVGWALGGLQSVKAGLIGVATGALAGYVGGLAWGATVAESNGSRLVVDPWNPMTFLVTTAIAMLIGLVAGGSRRAGAAAVARVIEGPAKGLEVLFQSSLTIGSDGSNDLRIVGAHVMPHHAVIREDGDAFVVESTAAIEIDGRPVVGGAQEVPPGAVLRIGTAFVKIQHRKDGGSNG